MHALYGPLISGRLSGQEDLAKAISRILVALMILLAPGLSVSSTSEGQAGQSGTCCQERELATPRVAMPAGEEQDWGGFFAGAVDSALVGPSAHTHCPGIVFKDADWAEELHQLTQKMIQAGYKQHGWPPVPPEPYNLDNLLDYKFVGTLTAFKVTGKTSVSYEPGYEPGTQTKVGGDLIGTFDFDLKLVDVDHDNAVLKENSCSWTGRIQEGLGFQRDDGTQQYMVTEMAKQFLPLDELIRDYERIPEECHVEVPGDGLQAGQTATIQLSGLFDIKGRPTQSWQHVLVKAEKGKILNGEAAAFAEPEEGFRVFRVGREGKVKVLYQAPSECKDLTDVLAIFNTCEKKENRPGALVRYPPEKQIANKTLKINGSCWDVDYTFTEQTNVSTPQYMANRQYSLRVRGRVFFKKSDRIEETYESESATIELNDSFNQHMTSPNNPPDPPTRYHATWVAQKNGQVPMKMTFKLHTRMHKYTLMLPAWEGDPIIIKGTYQWDGVPKTPDGAREFTCQTILHELPIPGNLTSLEDNGSVYPSLEPYQEGQTVLSGDRSNLRDFFTSVDCPCYEENLVLAPPPMPVGGAAGVMVAVNSKSTLLAGALKPFTASVKWVISRVK